MAIAWVEIQMPHKISYTEEQTIPRGAAGYRLTFGFKREISGDIREKLPVPFLRHVIQQAINLEKEHGHGIDYSEYKIRRLRYQVDVKFMKYSESGWIPQPQDKETTGMRKWTVSFSSDKHGFICKIKRHHYHLGAWRDHKQGQRKKGKQK